MVDTIRRAAAIRRMRSTVQIQDPDRFVFKYGAQGINGLAPGTFGIFDSEGAPQLVIKCPKCAQLSALDQNIDNEGRIEREVICPGCGWTAFALIHAWRETWRRIVGQYPELGRRARTQ